MFEGNEGSKINEWQLKTFQATKVKFSPGFVVVVVVVKVYYTEICFFFSPQPPGMKSLFRVGTITMKSACPQQKQTRENVVPLGLSTEDEIQCQAKIWEYSQKLAEPV